MSYNFHKNLTLDILTTQFIINGEIVWKTEEWRNIPGWIGYYQVSSFGRVKSLERKVLKSKGITKQVKERILRQGINKRGYFTVSLRKNGKGNTTTVSKLVAIVFLNHKPDGTNKTVVDHKDNVRTHDYLFNLQLITSRKNNSKDQFRHNRTSKYVGVCSPKNSKKWVASIKIDGKSNYLGSFEKELDAHIPYQDKLKQLL